MSTNFQLENVSAALAENSTAHRTSRIQPGVEVEGWAVVVVSNVQAWYNAR